MEIELIESESLQSSISIPESVRSQTKTRFDCLLKNALKKATPTNKSKCTTEFNKSSEKLIDNDGDTKDNEGFEIPIPKPRKIKNVHTFSLDSWESGGTYEVRSPKVVKEIVQKEGNENDDAVTYTKSPEKEAIVLDDKNEQIGDILVHSNATSPIIPVVEKKSPVNTKNDDTLSSSILIVETEQKPAENNEEIIVKYETPPNTTQDTINFENETEKPKPKKRTKKIKEESQQQKYDFENITAIVIHKTDRLQLSSLLLHPLVSVHIVNRETGTYLKKSDRNRAVTFYYENKKFDFISPILTQTYNMRNKRSLIPQWEETLLFNEDFKYITEETNNVIIFFEIVDFLTLSQANNQKSAIGWHKIAWAFLKPISDDGFLNTGKRVRLQLYKPGNYNKKNLQECNVFQWWSKLKWEKYPASLHVTVKGVPMPKDLEKSTRSKTPLTAEIESKEISVEHQNANRIITNESDKIKWRRIEHQACKMPNEFLIELETCKEGAFVLKFSNKGDFLAAAVVLNDVYTIKVFETETWQIHTIIPTHQSLIYNIIWSKNDEIILSASGDCTVSLWDFTKNSFVQMLLHPSFVYTCNITKENVIATGCYDKIVRIWLKNSKFVLRQELEKHSGYVTSLIFSNKGDLLYSADSAGVILEWGNNKNGEEWKLKRSIQLFDLKATIINQILLCKRTTKLIVHARDSALRVVDLENETVLHWFRGVLNNRIHTKCSLSPCGNFITCGSENGQIQVWNIYTEKCVATYTPCDVKMQLPIHDVQFHPMKNMLAFAHFGGNVPIFVYHYKETPTETNLNGNKSEVVLKKIQQDSDKLDFKSILCKIDDIIKMQK